jgi:aminopeptidase YwaD
MAHVRQLAENIGTRTSATEKEKQAADYLAEQFRSHGYQVEFQTFNVSLTVLQNNQIAILSPEASAVSARPMNGTGVANGTGDLMFAGLGRLEDVQGVNLKGAIALIQRGAGLRFGEKARNAQNAGAIGVVIFNDRPGILVGDLGGEMDIPAVSIGKDDGERLQQLLTTTRVQVNINISKDERQSQNVVATKKGNGKGIVVIGGHYDTVFISPGANDNASGTAVLLVIAEELASKQFPFDVRFIGFGSEELGLLGSEKYVRNLAEEERRQHIAMFNFDALGSGRLQISGSSSLVERSRPVIDALSLDIPVVGDPPNAASDHFSFLSVGIPVLSFDASDFSRIHTSEDKLEFVRPELLGQAVVIAIGALDSLAQRALTPQ